MFPRRGKPGPSKMKTVGIIGMGRVGSALAYTLDRRGYDIVVVSRRFSPGERAAVQDKQYRVATLFQMAEEADLVFIATPDGVIESIAEDLAKTAPPGCPKAVFHLSGAHSAELLAPLREKGVLIGSLHPLQSFANVKQAIENLPGSFFTYQGDAALIEEAGSLVEQWGGILKILPSPESKVIYHAGACLVSNYVVALAAMGVCCLGKAGFQEEEARRALVPLMEGTVNNIAALPLPKALTGPISRGDLEVIKAHLQVLEAELPEIRKVYRLLSSFLGELALKGNNISKETYQELAQIIKTHN